MTKLTIQAEKLNKILNLVSLGVEGRTSNQHASSFLINVFEDKIEFRANNSLIEAVYTYDHVFELKGDPISFCIEQFIHSVVSKMRGDIVFNFEKNNEVQVTGKNIKHKIAIIDPSGFPEKLPTPKNLIQIEDYTNFANLFKRANFAVSTLPDNKILQTFNITEANELIATNKIQGLIINKNVGIDKVDANPPAVQFIAALKAIDVLDEKDEFWVSFDDNLIYSKFVMSEGVLEYNISPIEGDFPTDVKDIMEDAEKQSILFKAVVEKKNFVEALDIALLYYNRAGMTGEAQFLTIGVDNEQLYFSSGIELLSDMKQEIDTKELESPDSFSFHLDPKDLMEFVSLAQGDVDLVMYNNNEAFVVLYDAEDPLLKYLQVTMKPGET